MVLLALPPADHRLIERDRGNCAFSATPHDGQRPCRGLAEDSRQHPAELRIRGAAAQTRVVSMAGIRLGSWESARAFKGIICHDISEFESHMPSQAVRSLWSLRTPPQPNVSVHAMTSAHSLQGLMKWLTRDEWRDRFAEVYDHHLLPACRRTGLDAEEVMAILGENWFMTTVWGGAFEDFLTREGADGRNIVDDYLKRRGWKESASTRAYMSALRTSVMS